MKEPKVAREVAELEFEKLCASHRIDLDMTAEEAAEFETEIRGPVVREIMAGTLVVGEGGSPTFTPVGGGKSYVIHPPTGATLMALETHPGTKPAANMIAALTEMTRSERGEFSRMPARDLNALGRIARLFLSEG